MSDDPLIKKLLKGWWAKMSGKSDERALEVIESMPRDILDQLRRNRRDAPLVKRLVEGWVNEQHAAIDTRELEAITKALTAGEEAWSAYERAMRARHKAVGLAETLEREDELAAI